MKNQTEQSRHPSWLEEKRRHGTASFPCAKYAAIRDFGSDHTTYFVKPHWHDSLEILFFEEGRFRLGINAESIEINAPCLAFVEQNSLHSIQTQGFVREHAVVFGTGILEGGNADAARREIINPIAEGLMRFPRFLVPSDPAYSEAEAIFRQLSGIFERSGIREDDRLYLVSPSAQLMVKASLMTLLASLYEYGLLKNEEKNPDERAESLKAVVTYIKEHYGEKIYIRDLASIMHMSEQYFIRFFHKTIGRSPQKYICDIRIREALALLEGTARSVTEIADQCGFASVGLFIEEFKKHYGTTPLVYRKRYREQLSEKN